MKRYLDYQIEHRGNYSKIRAAREADCDTRISELLGEGCQTIPGYPGYLVSKSGEVYSRQRGRVSRLRPGVKPGGYEFVGLRGLDGATAYKMVHRLVAEAFLPNPSALPTVNHRDGRKRNNHVHNLEWASHQDNIKHAIKNGLMRVGPGRPQTKLTAKQVRHIRLARGSYREIGEKFGICAQSVCNVKNGKTYRTVPA